MADAVIKTHPVQNNASSHGPYAVPEPVALRAYEAYCEVFSPQPAMITGGCRGGFGIGEMVAFLYARSFPKNEWRMRFDEACRGMKGLS